MNLRDVQESDWSLIQQRIFKSMLSDCCSCFFFIVSLGFGGFDIFYVWVQLYQFCVFGISTFFENPITNLMLMVVQVELLHELKGCLSRSDYQFSSVQFSRSVVPDSLWPHELQHARPPCPSPTLGVYPNSCPLSRCSDYRATIK